MLDLEQLAEKGFEALQTPDCLNYNIQKAIVGFFRVCELEYAHLQVGREFLFLRNLGLKRSRGFLLITLAALLG